MVSKYNKKLIKLKLGDIGSTGDTTAIVNSETINVFGGIPGEIVLAEIIEQQRSKRKQKRVFGTVKQILTPSRYRIKTPCDFYGHCTGCNWQHINYQYQLHLKQLILKNELYKYLNKSIKIEKIIPSVNQFNYRNHGRFSVRRNGQIGFTNKVTKKFVGINKCLIMSENINSHIKKLDSLVGETSQISIRTAEYTESFLIQPKIKNKKIKIETGQKSYNELINTNKFQISSPSFFQVNTPQISKMSRIINSLIKDINKNILIDAYAGVGTFGIILKEKFNKIIGIEQSYSAVIDAKQNIKKIKNYHMVIGNSEEVISAIKPKIDLLLLDPSRKGCDEKLLENLILNPVKNIIYISCEPKTLGRDLNLLTQNSKYKIISINPIDLFPNTHHVESITLLKLNK
ncbi:MAG: SAM-dependent methyltransferase [Chloroflexi bacterium]|nr:SAM-dependent methyltransferase [Chloroflexota bacterium]MBO98942.1 SAM-dependent methyltransferase [Chloroflexota bacterium]|tara:strand:- start:7764 stop:8966 length:1203 start_codon:yes stop_codon:yes gene_type:complete